MVGPLLHKCYPCWLHAHGLKKKLSVKCFVNSEGHRDVGRVPDLESKCQHYGWLYYLKHQTANEFAVERSMNQSGK